jgi:CxxC motif-containing protein (DUF1111 family)
MAAPRSPAQLGDAIPGLTAQQFAAFLDGKDDFTDVETQDSGLGPIFNRDSCVACHSSPAVGGASDVNVQRFGLLMAKGVFNPLESLGGSLLQERALVARGTEVVPPEANVTAFRNTTPLFGVGLVEEIPDAAILANVRPGKPDGVRGRAHIVMDVANGRVKRVGRFGWKAQHASLLAFAGDAYLNEMGITNRFFPTENAPNGNTQVLAELDTVVDPEDTADPVTRKADVDRLWDFMRALAPPPRQRLSPAAATGNRTFEIIGCVICHTPRFLTGRSRIDALSNKEVWLWSDLLLHDMGTLNDGIGQGDAKPTEMKTAPLWGLAASTPFLHDGRAKTIDEAIRAHDGEAKMSRDRYVGLTQAQRDRILEFLNSL